MLKNNEGLIVSTRGLLNKKLKNMVTYERVTDEVRNAIPEKDRCAVSYNGYHIWKLIGEDKSTIMCMKCLKQQKVVIDK
jgi:hypothetical protein